MAGQRIITNKDIKLRDIATDVLIHQMNFNVVDHASIYEWEFESVKDADKAIDTLANYFEFCQRR